MNRPPQNRRKGFLIALGLLCVLLTICVIFLRDTSNKDSAPKIPSPNHRNPEPTAKLISAAKPAASPKVFQSASVTVTETPIPQKDSEDIPPTNFTTGTLSPPRFAALHTSGSLAVAVVDVERLLAELLPDGASPEMRAQSIRDIQQATSSRAAAHNLDLVFDMSGKSLNNVPVISSAAGVFNLTEEVRHELTK